MAFIDKLLESGLPYGMTVEQPKAHDAIDDLIGDERLNQVVQDLVLGLTGGAGAGKGIRQLLLAMKGKIKGGKMIPSQPFRKGTVGKLPSKTSSLEQKRKYFADEIKEMADKGHKFEGFKQVSEGMAGPHYAREYTKTIETPRSVPEGLVAILSGLAGAGGAAYGMENLMDFPLVQRLVETLMPDPDMEDAGRMDLYHGFEYPELAKFRK